MFRKNTKAISGIKDTPRRSRICQDEPNHNLSYHTFENKQHVKTLKFITEVPMFRKLFYNESGQDMVEYALLASFISVVAIATLRLIGPLVSTIYQNVADALS